jgi:hypothetical protein
MLLGKVQVSWISTLPGTMFHPGPRKANGTDDNSRFLADGPKTYMLYKPQASQIFPIYQIRMRFLNSSHAGGHSDSPLRGGEMWSCGA